MLKILGVKLIRFYQKHLSRGTCTFIPSCSEYTLEAILKHGFFVGCFLGAKRILRCHPWTKGGFDKVPDKKSLVKWVY
ncbi:MAG: membrane protein insertion efficiency factor YidD [Clostridiales bacterium]|nr:membrane protein insertion efficiency factor YidD [Clostridiales bacterium]